MDSKLLKKVLNKLRFIWFRHRARLLRTLKTKIVKSAYGISFKENWTDNTFNYYIQGTYGFFYSSYLENYDNDFIFLDIGANQGLYSLLAASNNKCQSVYAFEPVKSIASLLNKNIEINNFNNITVFEKAISNSIGTVEISYNPLHTGLTSINPMNTNEDGNESLTLETVDYNFIEKQLSESKLDIVCKIDVEGHEQTVIEQLALLKQNSMITSIYYECDTRWINDDEVKKALSTMGFKNFQKVGYGSHYDVLASK